MIRLYLSWHLDILDILDIEDELDRIEAAFPYYPAHSSLTFDILENMFEESGLESNVFEEIHDIERFRKVQKHIIETNNSTSGRPVLGRPGSRVLRATWSQTPLKA